MSSSSFAGEQVDECVPFRISRNADLGLREDQAADLLAEMEEVLDARRLSDCVHLDIAAGASPTGSRVSPARVGNRLTIRVAVAPGPLDLGAFMRLAELSGFEGLKYEAWPPKPSPDVDLRSSMFDVIARRDVLLHHPYESFEPVSAADRGSRR
jgi:polyphosphate kinase